LIKAEPAGAPVGEHTVVIICYGVFARKGWVRADRLHFLAAVDV
jgi:hypothetical protein